MSKLIVEHRARERSLTSGLPFGSRRSCGTIFILEFFSSDGGDGLELYSVREKPLRLGVRGV